MSTFKQPLVYDALLLLYRTYWVTHRHLPRAFRMTTGEAILQEITDCIKQVILANNADKTAQSVSAVSGMYKSFSCCYQGASHAGVGNDIYCSWCFYAAYDVTGFSRKADHALAGLVYAS